jgi:hypothetical protein
MNGRGLALLLIAACALSFGATAQETPRPPAPAACPAKGEDLPLDALYGTWEARFDGVPGIATVRLGKHPDYAGVKGHITRGGEDGTPRTTAQLAGDIGEDGLLVLDESQDGHAISGEWSAELQPASCGREFRGTWHDTADDSTRSFVLNKTGSWQ